MNDSQFKIICQKIDSLGTKIDRKLINIQKTIDIGFRDFDTDRNYLHDLTTGQNAIKLELRALRESNFGMAQEVADQVEDSITPITKATNKLEETIATKQIIINRFSFLGKFVFWKKGVR